MGDVTGDEAGDGGEHGLLTSIFRDEINKADGFHFI
jgi:hypothetical protein